ncbi:MAG: zf-HC2 domain-containing protein [Armatimonadetes bacterium]|nr:zf-HC2 domain-containing protein [Armatimonadota bacterium]
MSQCDEIQDLLVAYIYEDLRPQERNTVGEHLASCQECRDRVGAYEGTLGALPTDLLTPSRECHERIVSRSRKLVEIEKMGIAPVWGRVLGCRWVQIGAAAAVFFALGMWVGGLVTRSLVTSGTVPPASSNVVGEVSEEPAGLAPATPPVQAAASKGHGEEAAKPPLLAPLVYGARPSATRPTWIQCLRDREKAISSLIHNSETSERRNP